MNLPTEEEIARTMFEVDFRVGAFDEDKAMAAREGLKWPTHSKKHYFNYAAAVLKLLERRIR